VGYFFALTSSGLVRFRLVGSVLAEQIKSDKVSPSRLSLEEQEQEPSCKEKQVRKSRTKKTPQLRGGKIYFITEFYP